VPKPRVNLTRYHGVFAPNSKHRALVTLAKQKEAEGPQWVQLKAITVGDWPVLPPKRPFKGHKIQRVV
jgi:hypothetical protein